MWNFEGSGVFILKDTTMNYNEVFRRRTRALALSIIRWYAGLEKKPGEVRVVGMQLIRAATSTAANYRAACRGRSKAERYSKICIVSEESDETVFWIEFLIEAKIADTSALAPLLPEAIEIMKVMASYKKKCKPGQ